MSFFASRRDPRHDILEHLCNSTLQVFGEQPFYFPNYRFQLRTMRSAASYYDRNVLLCSIQDVNNKLYPSHAAYASYL